MTIDVLVHPNRWLGDTAYRQELLMKRPKPPHTWRFVCRSPEGGIQVLACVSFMANGRTRTIHASGWETR